MKKLTLVLLLSCIGSVSLAQDTNPLQKARAAMAVGKPADAVAILKPLESTRAGEPGYDFLLGLALLDSGDPERAVFAFERVLAVQPDHAQARAEIGRAYLQLGERDAGVKELESVRKMGVPDDARRTIENYLNAFGAGPTRLSGYFETSMGHDSNINSGAASSRMAIPALGNLVFSLSRDGREQSSNFLNLNGGINVLHPLAQGWFLLGSGAFAQRMNFGNSKFNNLTIDGNLGVRYVAGSNALTFGFQGQTFDVEHERNRNALGLVGQWQHQLDAQNQISVFGQWTRLRYPDQELRDANRSILGVAYAKVFTGSWTPSMYASLYTGREKERNSDVQHLGHTPWGVRFGGQIRPSSSTTWFTNVSYEHRRYGGDDPLFLEQRRDQQWDLRLGMNYEPYRFWSVSPQLSYTRNRSNIAIYDYSRAMLSVAVRRDF